jgi:L-amino acid N-acyltransferase YncA
MATIIRPYRSSDREQCLHMGHLMHEESYYKFMDFDDDKVAAWFEASTAPDSDVFVWVAEEDGKLIGHMGAMCFPHFFTHQTISADMWFYVIPEKRGSMSGVKLLKKYIEWSEQKNVKFAQLGITTDINTDRTGALLERLGLKFGGTIFRKEF